MDMTSLTQASYWQFRKTELVIYLSRLHLQAATTQALKPLKVDDVAFIQVLSLYQCALWFSDLSGRSDNKNLQNKSNTQEFHFSSSKCLNTAFSFKFATIFIEIEGWGADWGSSLGIFLSPASNTLLLVGIWLSDLDFPNLSVKPVWESNNNHSWVFRDS